MTTPKGAILQRDGETYAIMPSMDAGVMDAQTLSNIAEVAKKYNIPMIKLTGAMRLALVGIKEENVDNIWYELDMQPRGGKTVRNVQACPGNSVCSYGKQNSLGLAEQIEAEFGGRQLPNKFKFSISGCPLGCSEPLMRDLGLLGTPKGWTMTVGGFSAGTSPRVGDVLAEQLDDQQVINLACKVIDAYQEVAKPSERFGRTLNRIGIDEFKKLVL